MKVQRGAAILTALLLMALVATLSTAALWQQARAYDLEAAERARVQANWVLQGTTDWARLISPTSTYHITEYAYAVAPGDMPWFNRVEQFVRDIKRDGRLLRAASRGLAKGAAMVLVEPAA